MSAETRQARIGFVGAGGHANYALYPSLAQAPSARLVAVCDVDAERAQRAAKKYGADRWYADVEEMLDAEQLDGVCICGPPQMHLEVGLQVLRRRLPIFVEKPSAMNSADALRLAEAADKAGVWGMVAFMKRHAEAYLLARRISQSPSFGGVQQLHLRFTQGEYPDLWGLEAPHAFLVGQVVHIFDLARFLGGDIAEVHARLRLVNRHRFAYAVSLRFAAGAVGTMELNTLDHTEPWRDITEYVDLSGVGESVVVRDMLHVIHYAAPDWRREEATPFGSAVNAWSPNWISANRGLALCGYVGELEHFAQCALCGTPASASLLDGAEALRVGEAVWRSANQEQAVTLNPGAQDRT